jgi:hypothetical protein
LDREKRLKVFFSNWNRDLEYIGNRRRFVGWARSRNVNVQLDSADGCDAAIFGVTSDLRTLARTKTFKVLDMADAYLSLEENHFWDITRNLYRKDRALFPLKFSDRLKQSCKLVDVVVVSTPEQLQVAREFNANAVDILDNLDEIPLLDAGKSSNSYVCKQRNFKIVWEGLNVTLKHLFAIKDNLKPFLSETDSELVIISNRVMRKTRDNWRFDDAESYMQSEMGIASERIRFVDWNMKSLVEETRSADFAIIPISQEDKFAMLKPENKLLVFLRLGVPTFFTNTPAYTRVSSQLGLREFEVCSEQWQKTFSHLSDTGVPSFNLSKVHQQLKRKYNSEVLLKKWDSVFEGLIK